MMTKLIKFLIFCYIIISPLTQAETISSGRVDDQSWQTRQEAFDREQHENYIEFKVKQNNLPDNQRSKLLTTNEYWLVNKKQDLWIGIFDGKYVKIPAGTYVNIPGETLFPESIIRIKRGGKISQFLLLNSNGKYPSVCVNRRDGILFDAQDYMVFYTGCARGDKLYSKKLGIFYNILFYSKTFDIILQLDEFPDSALQGDSISVFKKSVEKVRDYYIDYSIESAFKFTGSDQVIVVDKKTGKPQEKVPEIDDNGSPVMKNGKPVMIDDPDGFQPVILKRLPEVTVVD
ncbi:hypothetical protein [Klebsiella sp. HSTU-Sny5]|uniref:hypothetical protein n=1 Tax=Klebsiella sp. HSTU-Sny5 TaxID=2663238 RepID=UPI001FB75AC5|nr:hypothetical protein [Klebsiella sp. HSTU-Sny5]